MDNFTINIDSKLIIDTPPIDDYKKAIAEHQKIKIVGDNINIELDEDTSKMVYTNAINSYKTIEEIINKIIKKDMYKTKLMHPIIYQKAKQMRKKAEQDNKNLGDEG